MKTPEGKLIGLVGRAIGESSNAKYLNIKGIEKGETLFLANIVFAELRALANKGAIQQTLYLTEGFFDAIRLRNLGIPAVAVMGAQLTKQQAGLLHDLNLSLPEKCWINYRILFDNDAAGIRGASSAIERLLNLKLDTEVTYLSQIHKVSGQEFNGKDPDEVFRYIDDPELVRNALDSSSYPPALAFLVSEFGENPRDILSNETWDSFPRSRRYRALQRTTQSLQRLETTKQALEKLIKGSGRSFDGLLNYQLELIDLITGSGFAEAGSRLYIANDFAQLNHARTLGYMGSRRGELPCAEPEWERLDIAATVFNTLICERLANGLRQPVGSFDAVLVPRKFNGHEPRLKVMPRPVDLIVQQYLMNELLTERHDQYSLSENHFSSLIPAVRYYSHDRKTITTGQNLNNQQQDLVLSFAYQVDMEVLEGRAPPSDQGMFRPFMECWRDFMESLKKQANEIGLVHSVRLDVKRYYDHIQRYVVRDAIQPNLSSALSTLQNTSNQFAKLFQSKDQDRAAVTVDALCDLIFGYPYQDPETGALRKSDDLIGIPQGPVISAWLGSIVLFPVDNAARELIAQYGKNRIGYARYVDDIVLLADSPELLASFRAKVEVEVRKLGLSLLAKADPIPASSADKFFEHINDGRVFAGYAPAWEPAIIGDGEVGWDMWSDIVETDRQSALQILRDPRLFSRSADQIASAISTAFQAEDLRPSELAKGARWIWLAVAKIAEQEEIDLTPKVAWDNFICWWKKCCDECNWSLDVDNHPWDDLNLVALEGLEKLIESTGKIPFGLSRQDAELRNTCIKKLAQVVLNDEFKHISLNSLSSKLHHQLERRVELLEWHAQRLISSKVPNARLKAHQAMPFLASDETNSPFAWMDIAISRLMATSGDLDQDPLDPLREKIQTGKFSTYKTSWEVANALLSQQELAETPNTETKIRSIALQTIVAVSPKAHLLDLLSRRPHLLSEGDSDEKLIMMSPLPGILQSRLLAFKNEHINEVISIKSFVLIELEDGNHTSENHPEFYGSVQDEVDKLKVNWQLPHELENDVLKKIIGDLSPEDYITTFNSAPDLTSGKRPTTPKYAAELFEGLINIQREYQKEPSDENKELVPAWPFIGFCEKDGRRKHYILCEAVETEKLANRAFVRDIGRSLRSINVPIEEAYLWRTGVAVSDYLGLQDDVIKLADHNDNLILDENALQDPASYVLRSQLRKLRGTFIGGKVFSSTDKLTGLPSAVHRALKILHDFPTNADKEVKLFCLLASESETEAMRMRYENNEVNNDGLKSKLHNMAIRMLAKLPVSLAEILASPEPLESNLRRDTLALACLSRKIWSHQPWENTEITSAVALKASVVLSTCTAAFRGLVSSLLTSKNIAVPSNIDLPSREWPSWTSEIQSSSQSLLDALRNNDCKRLSRWGALDWLCVLICLLENDLRIKEWANVKSDLEYIASQLVEFEVSQIQDDSSSWPFEDLSIESMRALDIKLVEIVCILIPKIDRLLNIGVRQVALSGYGFNQQKYRFVDSLGQTWEITPTQVTQLPANPKSVEEIIIDKRLRKVWCEAYSLDDQRLLSIHVLGHAFSKVAFKPTDSLIDALIDPVEIVEEFQPQVLVKKTEPDVENTEQTKTLDQENLNNEKVIDEALSSTFTNFDAVAAGFRKNQSKFWGIRGQQKCESHMRVAFIQFRIDDTYKHPLAEGALNSFPFDYKEVSLHGLYEHSVRYTKQPGFESFLTATKSGAEHNWDSDGYLASWAEHRRQKILRETINACERLGVDLLVLPEYSVRPETINWLKTELSQKHLAVLAGSFREFNHGDEKDYLSAKMKLLWPYPQNLKNNLISTLKQRDALEADIDKVQNGLVLEFGRAKKYRSVAMDENIYPSSQTIKPLFEPGEVARKVESEGAILANSDLIELLTSTKLPLKFCQELICSELFMLTSPANLKMLAYDYDAQNKKFFKTKATGKDQVFEDLDSLSEHLGFGAELVRPRRSVLLVPAATSRSADYWIAGQANLLAAGTTTVFCNGVSKFSNGNSCFIGHESWKATTKGLGVISPDTPYHGWSKGIYYNNPTDPLNKEDQAVVIADIDPVHMLGGKPRPQMLQIPLQLVAYLPIVELLDTGDVHKILASATGVEVKDLSKDNMPLDDTKIKANKAIFWKSVDEVVKAAGNRDKEKTALNNLSFYFSDQEAFKARSKYYINDRDQQPRPDPSPASYDWIVVDHALNDMEKIPTIDVPAWKKN